MPIGLTIIPAETDGQLGGDKADIAAPPNLRNYTSAVEWNTVKKSVRALLVRIGLGDGSQANTIEKKLVDLEAFVLGAYPSSPTFVAPTLGTATATKITSNSLIATPLATAYASTLSLDVAARNDHDVGALTGNITITLTNGVDGCSGVVDVVQDGTGGWTVSIVASGRTVKHDVNVTDLVAATAAGAITQYPYMFRTIGGTAYLVLGKSVLS